MDTGKPEGAASIIYSVGAHICSHIAIILSMNKTYNSVKHLRDEEDYYMKSLEELKAIREKAKANMGIREDRENMVRVMVGMATCGIAAGARPVLSAFVNEIANEKLDVIVGQTGCIGICQYEPVVEIFEPDGTKTTYVKMTPERAAKVVHRHLKGGEIVNEYTIGSVNK